MKSKIENMIVTLEEEIRTNQAYPYLIDIVDILKQMLDSFETLKIVDQSYREKIVAGLGRLITEDYAFSEGELGEKLMNLGEEYINYKEK